MTGSYRSSMWWRIASGNSPDFLDAVDACVGVTTFVAIPSETRCWLQRPQTEDKIYTYKGDVCAKRVMVAPPTPQTPWRRWRQACLRRAGISVPSRKAPRVIVYAFARQRVTLCQEGQPDRTVWLILKRTVGANPVYSYYIGNAPISTPLRTFVWLSGLRWAIEQCCEEGKTGAWDGPL